MKDKLQQALRKFRRANPQAERWSDDEVLEAMFSILAQQKGTGITLTGRRSDGD